MKQKMRRIRREPPPPLPVVLVISSEAVPYSKTGGLADVAGALPLALARCGFDAVLVTPRYASVDVEAHRLAKRLKPIEVTLGGRQYQVDAFEGRLGREGGGAEGRGPRAFLIDYQPAFARKGLYREGQADYEDNWLRFALFARAALALCPTFGIAPAIIHANDWQAALAALYLKRDFASEPAFSRTKSVFTIHNMAYQGLFAPSVIEELGLGWDLFNIDGLEFWGKVNFLKAGVVFADAVTTVSERYAAEIQTEEFGCGLEGLMRSRGAALSGIVNGIDHGVWNPATDKAIAANYSPESLTGKGRCKLALQEELKLARDLDAPLIGMIGRLIDQKGFDLVAEAADEVVRDGAQIAILGTGDAKHELFAKALAARHAGRVSATIGFDDGLAHRIEAGADMFLMPSRFEPCGLNQLYSLKYGTVPIVRATGGLDDTVADHNAAARSGTGFKFSELSRDALVATVKRALATYADAARWRELMLRGMACDFSWNASAERYARLYRALMGTAVADRLAK